MFPSLLRQRKILHKIGRPKKKVALGSLCRANRRRAKLAWKDLYGFIDLRMVTYFQRAQKKSNECELIYPPCTYLTCENITTRKETNLAGIRCLSVRATVSTSRKEVDNIRTVKDKPHEDASRKDYAQVLNYIFCEIVLLDNDHGYCYYIYENWRWWW